MNFLPYSREINTALEQIGPLTTQGQQILTQLSPLIDHGKIILNKASPLIDHIAPLVDEVGPLIDRGYILLNQGQGLLNQVKPQVTPLIEQGQQLLGQAKPLLNDAKPLLDTLKKVFIIFGAVQVWTLILLCWIAVVLVCILFSVNPDLEAERKFLITPLLKGMTRPLMYVATRGRELEIEYSEEQRGAGAAKDRRKKKS